MSEASKGFLENIPWQAIVAAIVTVLTLFFAFPDYVLNIRPKIVEAIGNGTLSFIEGTITGAVLTVLVLKFLAERRKKQKKRDTTKIRSEDVKIIS